MNSMKFRIAVLILIVGILSACVSQTPDTPASQPTEAAVSIIETPTNLPLPTRTAVATAAVQATEVPVTQPAGQSPEGTTISFTNDVFPILQSRCINCHGGDRTEEGLVMLTYAELMAGSDNGPVVTPGDAVNSLFAELVSAQKMPKRGPKLTPPQVQVIIDWINQGALDN